MARDGWIWGLGFVGLVNVLNGFWMIFAPAGWYTGIPAAVPDFGPFNAHFVRDIGAAYVTVGAALLWAAFSASSRAACVGLATIFYALHAAAHVYDTLSGHVGPEHWAIDFPAIYLPVLLLVPAWIVLARRGTQ
ncbi:MAG: hypothetical protein ACREQY_08810 [Candidatus Binatia bacterium]